METFPIPKIRGKHFIYFRLPRSMSKSKGMKQNFVNLTNLKILTITLGQRKGT